MNLVTKATREAEDIQKHSQRLSQFIPGFSAAADLVVSQSQQIELSLQSSFEWVSDLDQKMDEFSVSLSRISELAKSITDIAGQTSLLAPNAAI